jgi:GTP1/Obg family GTP-binding protein
LIGDCLMPMYVAIPSHRPSVSIHARWSQELRSFQITICMESALNNNTKAWSKAKLQRFGKTSGEFPTVDDLLKFLEYRELIDVKFVETQAKIVVDQLNHAMHGLS